MTEKHARVGCAHAHGYHRKSCIVGEGSVDDSDTGFRFGRIMPQGTFQPMILKESAARAIGAEMVKPVDTGDSPIPSGYTYFGQFVDHDITRDITAMEADNPATDAIEPTPDSGFETMQGRSPALDLDSLYGRPDRGRDPALFRGAYFKVGRAAPSIGAAHSDKPHPNDLPRGGQTGTNGGALALIPDPRNDENLAVAQTHLMMMLFHNNMVGTIESAAPDKDENTVFAEARALVTKHYQHIVLHDFVRQMITEEVYKEVIVGGKRSFMHQCAGEVAFMPLEFSVAAYRMGHSMVRPSYDWNVNFGTGGALLPAPSPFSFLFQFSALSGSLAGPGEPPASALPSNWIADFRRMFDLSGYKPTHLSKAGKVKAPNFAKKMDPYLAMDLKMLPADGNQNLGFLNLRRGALRGLPSGQDLSRFMHNVKVLSKSEMKKVFKGDASFDRAMDRFGFYDRTPLWLYVLIEAAAREKGDRLGEMGSRILAETFLTMAITSRISVFGGGKPWTPKDAEALTRPVTPLDTIAGVLEWIDRAEPVVNPLEDLRVGAL